MNDGINNHLKRIASRLLMKNNGLTEMNISRSLSILNSNLKKYFLSNITYIKVFGSYSRGTMLPREFDPGSDIDVLIGFASDSQKLKPESYRERIKRFAEKNYPKSRIVKDHPSIVIELNHINFDLVPCIYDRGWVWDSLEIPDKDGGWMETSPDDFGKKLTQANQNNQFIVKPLIRLLKVWNASHGYPYYPFDLEQAIVEMRFTDYSYERGLIDVIAHLPVNSLSSSAVKKVESLQKFSASIQTHLERQEIDKAKALLDRIVPLVA